MPSCLTRFRIRSTSAIRPSNAASTSESRVNKAVSPITACAWARSTGLGASPGPAPINSASFSISRRVSAPVAASLVRHMVDDAGARPETGLRQGLRNQIPQRPVVVVVAGHSRRCRAPDGGRNDGALPVGARRFQDDTGVADRLTDHIDHRVGDPADQPPDFDNPLSAAEGERARFIVQERGIRIDRAAVQIGEPKRIFGICHNLPFQHVAPFADQPVVGAEQQKQANFGARLSR